MQVFGLDSTYLGYDAVVDFCEEGNEVSGSINGVNLFNPLNTELNPICQ